ncbi:MAG: hypothetical protein J0G36_03530 [Afipia sp.]|jgi:hypothetical protein|nr:hypothetical protein [Afipia sp.]
MKWIGRLVDWVLDPFGWIASWIGLGADSLSKDYREDPTYKENLKRLIARNREIEEEKK